MTDGCGWELRCGACAEGVLCGTNFRCMGCAPKACDGRCGIVSNGCGANIDCGPCGEIRVLALPANGLVSDRRRGKLYISLPSTFGLDGNSVAVVNPSTGDIEEAIFVGSEPTVLALSDDESLLYVALVGAPRVVQVDVESLSVVGDFDLGVSDWFGPLFAEQIAVLPGSPGSVAVSTWRKGVSPRHGGVGIWDDGVRRDRMTRDHTGANRIAFASSPSILYGYNNETTEFGFRAIAVRSDGLEELSVSRSMMTGFGTDIESSGGLILSTLGHLVDPEGPKLLGSYQAQGAIESDPETGLTYVVNSPFSSPAAKISLFDRVRFVPQGEIGLRTSFRSSFDLVRWGSRGLAFRTGESLVLVESDLIANGQTVAGR